MRNTGIQLQHYHWIINNTDSFSLNLGEMYYIITYIIITSLHGFYSLYSFILSWVDQGAGFIMKQPIRPTNQRCQIIIANCFRPVQPLSTAWAFPPHSDGATTASCFKIPLFPWQHKSLVSQSEGAEEGDSIFNVL